MSDKRPPDYDAIEATMWIENSKEVITRLNEMDENILKRIQTYIDRFNYSRSDVENKIRQDPMFAAFFAKEPRRQSFHEIVACNWLQQALELKVEQLPQTGKNAMYVTSDGMIMTIPKNERKPSKSLDFYWTKGTTDFYAMHKYTKEGGGNQDSQYKEMVELLQNFTRALNNKNVLFVIVDGRYYDATKMDKLQRLTRKTDPKSFAVHIQDVPDIVKRYADN